MREGNIEITLVQKTFLNKGAFTLSVENRRLEISIFNKSTKETTPEDVLCCENEKAAIKRATRCHERGLLFFLTEK